ncbi:MAG: hypothetical protein OH340_00160 [Candidatus Parvarchaeota archaeon]|nr:hypothetical protein [Candidatus Rehaiarchaeum fermentans]
MDEKDILGLINRPYFAVDVAKLIGRDTIQTLAILDYLCANGKLKKTKRKIGTSSLYYLPEQDEDAHKILYDYLSAKEKNIVDKIKERKYIPISEFSQEEKLMLADLDDFVKIVSVITKEGSKITYAVYYKYDPKELLSSSSTKEDSTSQSVGSQSLNTETLSNPPVPKPTISRAQSKKVVNIDFDKYEIKITDSLEKGVYLGNYGVLEIPVIVFVQPKISSKSILNMTSLSSELNRYCIIFTNSNIKLEGNFKLVKL